jgi:hypothetical protein
MWRVHQGTVLLEDAMASERAALCDVKSKTYVLELPATLLELDLSCLY